jgi:serine/threonine-protein kinase HipA
MKLAMSVGNNNHYRVDEIRTRHLFQTGDAARLSRSLVRNAIEDVAARMGDALTSLETELPADVPQALHDSVSAGARAECACYRRALTSSVLWQRIKAGRHRIH